MAHRVYDVHAREPLASASRSATEDLSANEVGQLYRGMWYVLHLAGARAVDDAGMRFFKTLVEYYCQSFPCVRCRSHLKKFYAENPLRNFVNMEERGRPVGMAHWSWMLHNRVNTHLGKPYMDWDTFTRLWLSGGGTSTDIDAPECSKECGS